MMKHEARVTNAPPVRTLSRAVSKPTSALGAKSSPRNPRDQQLQARLFQQSSSDAAEQEADRQAQRVMSVSEPAGRSHAARPPGYQAKAANRPVKSSKINSGHSQPPSLQGRGQPLLPSERGFFEPRFDADFSAVRLHNDQHAAKLAKSIDARAFTYGHDVVFGAGEYSMGSTAGRHLLAHELTHVLQQSGAAARIQTKPLPKKNAESVTYTFERLISELNDLIDNNMIAQANKKAKQVISWGNSEIMAQMHGYEAAKALFRLDMADEAEHILELSSKAYFGSHSRMQPSLAAVKLILGQAEAAATASKQEYAYKLFEKAFHWLERYELTTTSSTSSLSFGAYSSVKDLYPRLVKGIFGIPAYYRAQNDSARQKAYLAKIKTLFASSSIADRYASLVAQAFLDRNMIDAGIEMLKEGQKDYQPYDSYDDWSYPKSKTEFLLDNAQNSLAAKDWDKAYAILLASFKWIKDNHKALDNWVLNVGQKRSFIEQSMYRLMDGLLSIVDYFIVEAEQGYQKADPNAAANLTTASAWIDKIKKDINLNELYTITVAKTHQKQRDSKEASYQDARDSSRKSIKVSLYDVDRPSSLTALLDKFSFTDRKRRMEQIIEAKRGQAKTIQAFYETDKDVVDLFRKKKGREPNIHNINDRKLFWGLKYDHLTTSGGKSSQEAVQALMTSIDAYLGAFTIHTKYDISDAKTDVISGDYPKSITRQALMDCGVFAMRTAHELSLIRGKAKLDFYFVSILNHVMLGIVDKGLAYGWGASNNQIVKLDGNLAVDGVGRVVQDTFAAIPSPLVTKKIGKTDQSSLVAQFRALPVDQLFLPDNFTKLKPAEQKQAKQQADSLKAQYVLIRKDYIAGTYQFSALLWDIGEQHARLAGIADDREKQKKTTAFNTRTADRIDKIRQPYEKYCDRLSDFNDSMKKIRGNKTYSTLSGRSMIYNGFHMILYAAHKLGKSDWASDKWIKSPIMQTLNKKYKGDPPPWNNQVARFNFNKD